MSRSLAIAAALTSVLAVSACGSGDTGAGSDPAAPGAEPSRSARPIDVGGDDASSLSSGSDAREHGDQGEPGLPGTSGASVDDVLRLGAIATWIDEPDVLAISLPASEDCWPTAGTAAPASPSRLAVEFTPAECESAHAVRTYTLEVPEGIEPGADFEVAIEGLAHEFTLPLPVD